MRGAAKQFVFTAAGLTGLTTLSRHRHRGCGRILAYHGVDASTDRHANFDGFQVQPDVFESHLRVLARGYHVLPLSEMAKSIRDGRCLPNHAVALTFDDGYLNNLEFATPLLLKYGMPATFFLTTGFIDGTHAPWWYRLRSAVSDTALLPALEAEIKNLPAIERERRLVELAAPATEDTYPMMTWHQVNVLKKSGFEIGAHTISHVSLGRETDAVVESEIFGSIRRVTEMTGSKPTLFAYPYGRPKDISERARACLREQGCLGAVTTTQGMNLRGDDVLRLKRLNITGNHTAGAFAVLVSGLGSYAV